MKKPLCLLILMGIIHYKTDAKYTSATNSPTSEITTNPLKAELLNSESISNIRDNNNELHYGQGFGLAFAFTSHKYLSFDLVYGKAKNNYKIGVSFQSNSARGKRVDEQLSNYGRTTDGNGSYFLSLDLGYGKTLKSRYQLDGEISIGTINYYTNYLDNRFNGGGYHMINNTDTKIGLGLNAGYLINENFSIYTGFNTLKKFQFGVKWFFNGNS